MSRKQFNNVLKLGALGLVLGLLGACAQQVGDIDRTQPDKVKKAIFQDGGEWYYKHTVVEVPPSAGFVPTGSQSLGERIYWEIQKDYLLARRAHEYRVNSEFNRTTNRVQNDDGSLEKRPEGAIVAAYRIVSHFDIQRQYNASTGEQTNVIVENGSDRHWTEREYMRVDWSANMAEDVWFDDWVSSPVGYYVSETDTENPDRPLILDDYIEIVNKTLAAPDTEYISGYGSIPSCWLSLDTDCAGQVVKVRSSFMKRTADREMFKPVEWDQRKHSKFQLLAWWHPSHDDDYGTTHSGIDWKATIYNIWDNAYEPMEFRRPRPIIFYLNANYPIENPEIMWATRKTFEDWNNLFKEVAREQGYEGDADFVILCENNPVLESDREECRTRVYHEKEGDKFVRIEQDIFDITRDGWIGEGDVRFNQLNLVLQPQNVGRILAFAQRLWDHQTGETLSATTHVFRTQDWANARTVDWIQLINGDLPVEDYITGNYIRDRINDSGINDDRIDEERQPLTSVEARQEALVDISILSKIKPELGEKLAQIDVDRVRERAQRRIRDTAERGGVGIYEQRLEQLKPAMEPINARIRAQILDESKNLPPELQPTEAQLDLMTPMATNPRDMRKAVTEYQRFLSERHMLDASYLDNISGTPTFVALANRFKGMPRAEIRKYVDAVGYYYTISHEIGHNMGLHHNFAGSSDPLNFPVEYWLEKGRLAFLPEFLVEEEALVENFDNNQLLRASEYASIMDYSFTDFRDEYSTPEKQKKSGLGRSDRAAIFYGYAGLVEVFDKEAVPETYEWVGDDGVTRTVDVRKEIVEFDPEIESKVENFHYTFYPNFALREDRISVTSGALGGLVTDTVYVDSDGPAGPAPATPFNETTYERLSPIIFTAAVALSEGRRWATEEEVIENNLIEVPYRTCTNGLEDSLWYCQMHDRGADLFERIRNEVRYRDFVYFTTHFVRDRELLYTPTYYAWNSAVREFQTSFNLYKHWINRALIEERAHDPESDWFLRANGGMDGFLGSMMVLEHWQKFLARPTMSERGYRVRFRRNANGELEELDPNVETGALDPIVNKARYYLNRRTMQFEPMDQYNEDDLDTSVHVDFELGEARYRRSEYDPALGYDYYYHPIHMGDWIAKLISILMASDPYTDFVGTDTGGDTAYALNLATLFDHEVFRTIAGFITEDPSMYAYGAMLPEGPGTADVRPLQDVLSQLLDSEPREMDAHIMPNESFTAQLAGLAWVTYLFDVSANNPFAEALNVMIEGEDREIGEDLVEGEDYIRVKDFRGGTQTYVIFRHARQGGLFVRRNHVSPTWRMAERINELYAQYGFEDQTSFEEAMEAATAGLSEEEATRVEGEFNDVRFEIQGHFEKFDVLRLLLWQDGNRYPIF